MVESYTRPFKTVISCPFLKSDSDNVTVLNSAFLSFWVGERRHGATLVSFNLRSFVIFPACVALPIFFFATIFVLGRIAAWSIIILPCPLVFCFGLVTCRQPPSVENNIVGATLGSELRNIYLVFGNMEISPIYPARPGGTIDGPRGPSRLGRSEKRPTNWPGAQATVTQDTRHTGKARAASDQAKGHAVT